LAPSPLRFTAKEYFGNLSLAVIVLSDEKMGYEYARPFVKCMYHTYSTLLKIFAFALYTSPVSTGFAKPVTDFLLLEYE
jgi:hypothetical protein